MERITLDDLRGDPALFERLESRARRERAAVVGACFARLRAALTCRVYNTRSSRGVAKERACSGRTSSTANAS